MIKTFGNSIQRFDIAFILFVSKLNSRYVVDKIFYIISKIGDGPLYILIGVALIFTPVEFSYHILLIGFLAFAIELPVYFIVKKYVKRLRPFEQMQNINHLIAPPDKYSFPSGHTSAAFVMATLFSAFFNEVAFFLFLLASLIGFSRIYLRVHYPTDIFAGAALGIISANLSIWILG